MEHYPRLVITYEDRVNRKFEKVEVVGEKDETPRDACKRIGRDGFFIHGCDEDTTRFIPPCTIINIDWTSE